MRCGRFISVPSAWQKRYTYILGMATLRISLRALLTEMAYQIQLDMRSRLVVPAFNGSELLYTNRERGHIYGSNSFLGNS
jgi:hypothetical protein